MLGLHLTIRVAMYSTIIGGTEIIVHEPNLRVISTSLAPTGVLASGTAVTLSATLKNYESKPIRYDAIGIPVRFYDKYAYDVGWQGPGIIEAGGTVNISGSRTFDKPGPYTAWVAHNFSGRYIQIPDWHGIFTKKYTAVSPSPNFSIIPVGPSTTTATLGQTVSFSFKLKTTSPLQLLLMQLEQWVG
jgi:hypothetical protein